MQPSFVIPQVTADHSAIGKKTSSEIHWSYSMALSRSNFDEIPEDAVTLTSDEAFTYQWKLIENWENTSEVWSLKFSPEILGATGAVTGIYMNNYYRKKLKLGNYGKLSTYLPIVVLPAITTVVYHKFFIQRDIILEPFQCPVCIQLRSAAFQSTLGVLHPTLLAPIASFMFATRHFTFRLPSITEKPMEVLALWRKMTRPLVPVIGVAISVHTIIAMYITFKETQQYVAMQLKMQELEEQALANSNENTL